MKMTRGYAILLIGIILGVGGQIASIYFLLRPAITEVQDSFDLKDFRLVPYLTCCYYYSLDFILLEPGNSVSALVHVFYQSVNQLTVGYAPIVYLVSASQFTSINANSGFISHVYVSTQLNATIIGQTNEVQIKTLITNIQEKAQHYFVVVPRENGGNVVMQRIEVQGQDEFRRSTVFRGLCHRLAGIRYRIGL
jgi:hypothetical protein